MCKQQCTLFDKADVLDLFRRRLSCLIRSDVAYIQPVGRPPGSHGNAKRIEHEGCRRLQQHMFKWLILTELVREEGYIGWIN
jgi:hypothetical protein